MSRIADALARARVHDDSVLSTAVSTVEPSGGPLLPAEWRFDTETARASLAPPNASRRSAAREVSEPVRGVDPRLMELVQRVFRPGEQPLARVVTLAAVGRASTPQPLGLSIARTLASYGAATVCVVDASGGAAGSESAVGTHPPGVGDMLDGHAAPASVAAPAGRGVWCVPAGVTAWPADWPDAWPHAVAALAKEFDFVIVVAAAVEGPEGVGAFLALAMATDGVLLTIDIAQTRPDVAADVVSRVRASGVEVFGAITVQPARGGRLRGGTA